MFRPYVFDFSTLELCWRGSSETTRPNPNIAKYHFMIMFDYWFTEPGFRTIILLVQMGLNHRKCVLQLIHLLLDHFLRCISLFQKVAKSTAMVCEFCIIWWFCSGDISLPDSGPHHPLRSQFLGVPVTHSLQFNVVCVSLPEKSNQWLL